MKTDIDGDGNIVSNRDTIINKYNDAPDDYGVIKDVFDYVINSPKLSDNSSIRSTTKDKLIHIKEKIDLNFDKSEIEVMQKFFTLLYRKITFVEKAFQTLSSDEQNDIHVSIYNEYNLLKKDANLTSGAIIDQLTTYLLPQKKRKNPEYISVAKAIVLFFFDDCTIFEKTSKEPIQISLFDNL